jgi:hypothetical protein
MHKAENIRGYHYLCIRRGSVERPVEQIKEPACAMNTTDAYRPPESILLLTSLTWIGSEYSLLERLLLLLSTYHDLTTASPLLARQLSRQAAVRRRTFVGVVIPKRSANPLKKIWENLIQ